MRTQKLTWRQWAAIAIFSYCGALAFSIRFAMPKLPANRQINALAEIVWNLRESLSGAGIINATLLFGSLVGLGILAYRMREAAYPPRTLLPVSFVIALVWLMGASFSIDNTLESLDASPGQIVKSVCYVFGSTYLLYESGQIVFCVLKKKSADRPEGRGKLAQIYQRHPFGVSFFAVLLFWLPHLIFAYPANFCADARVQMAQFVGLSAYTTHHPVTSTLIMGGLFKVGSLISGNFGLFFYITVQTVTGACVLAYTLYLMRELNTPIWLRLLTFGCYVFVPYYTAYIGVFLKDVPYTYAVLLFEIELLYLLLRSEDFFRNKRHIFLLVVSIAGTILLRNNGKHMLYPTIAAVLLYFFIRSRRSEKNSKGRGRILYPAAAVFLISVLLTEVFSAALISYLHAEPGSIKEALSFPFQQTARYVLERGDEVTDEEEEAIRAVLDYDHLAENYMPERSDPVKRTYNNNATKEELLQYFAVWFRMFFKHPEIYFKATMNQNYYLLYPNEVNDVTYVNRIDAAFPKYSSEQVKLMNISDVEPFSSLKVILKDFYTASFSFPGLNMLSHPAFYMIMLIWLTLFSLYQKRFLWVLASIPLWLSAVTIVFAPIIQGHPRYAFPIIYTMPILVAYYISWESPDSKF